MYIRMALPEDIGQLEEFFSKHITRENEAVYSEEFLCVDGLRAAVKRKSVVVLFNNGIIIAAARIYQRRNGSISLYQFAVDQHYRGKNLIRILLSQIGLPVFSACPVDIKFNQYFERTMWTFIETKKGMNIWKLDQNISDVNEFEQGWLEL